VFERAIGNLAESLGYRDVGTAVHSILTLPNRPS
jgi:hypothetical protein